MPSGKRVLDVSGAMVGLVVLSPILLVVALLIYLEDRGTVFFRQQRIGMLGAPFRIWKFRSMRPDAHRTGGFISVGLDPRVTRIGRFLRASKLDELPQLLNVLRGEMSLVGPRPEVAHYVRCYSAQQRAVLRLRPGITDPASLRFRNESAELAKYADPQRAYLDVIMPEKIRINLWYASRATLLTDLSVILATVGIQTAMFQALMQGVLIDDAQGSGRSTSECPTA